MAIPQSFLQTLLDRSDIADVIGLRVPIKKKGSSYFGCCPFHQEKSASFHVSPQKQFYYCFGCGAHGNAITFLREYDGLDFIEAVEALAQPLGLSVPEEEMKGRQIEVTAELSAVYTVLERASKFYQWQLRHHEKASEAVDYLKNRQVSGKTAQKFGLGFAPDGWDLLLKQIGGSPTEGAALMAAGLIIQNDQNRRYDRFRYRLMFPIRDRKGRVVGFGGRVLSTDHDPKYLNSPETEVFHKGSLLYGLYELKQERAEDFILIVEGYMDVVMLSEYGIMNAVATLGTAATPEHMKQLFRQSNRLIFSFDGDRAGREAAKRAAKVILPFMHSGHRSAQFLFLPETDDPDSYVKKWGKDAFLERVQSAKPLLDFIWDMMVEGLDLGLLSDRAQLGERGMAYCRLLPEGVYRTMLINQLAEGSRLTIDQIFLAMAKEEAKESVPEVPKARATLGSLTSDPLAMHAIYYLCNDPSLAQGVSFSSFAETSGDMSVLKELLKVCHAFDHPTFPMVLEAVDPIYLGRLVEIAENLHIQVCREGFVEICYKLAQRDLERQLKALIEKSKKGDLNPEEKIFLRDTLKKKKPLGTFPKLVK